MKGNAKTATAQIQEAVMARASSLFFKRPFSNPLIDMKQIRYPSNIAPTPGKIKQGARTRSSGKKRSVKRGTMTIAPANMKA